MLFPLWLQKRHRVGRNWRRQCLDERGDSPWLAGGGMEEEGAGLAGGRAARAGRA